MLQTRSSALRLASRLRPRTQRRFESSHTPDDAHHVAAKSESFGPGLYVMILVAPVTYLIYTRSYDPKSEPSFLAKWIPDFQSEWEKRNSLHTVAVEQAGRDRALFHDAPRRQNVELRFNEVFNTGSPFNKHSSNSVNLEGVINHYKQKNKETAEAIPNKTAEQIYAASSS